MRSSVMSTHIFYAVECIFNVLVVLSDMVPDMERIIESIVQRDQDTVQLLLNSYNTQVTDGYYDYCISL